MGRNGEKLLKKHWKEIKKTGESGSLFTTENGSILKDR